MSRSLNIKIMQWSASVFLPPPRALGTRSREQPTAFCLSFARGWFGTNYSLPCAAAGTMGGNTLYQAQKLKITTGCRLPSIGKGRNLTGQELNFPTPECPGTSILAMDMALPGPDFDCEYSVHFVFGFRLISPSAFPLLIQSPFITTDKFSLLPISWNAHKCIPVAQPTAAFEIDSVHPTAV